MGPRPPSSRLRGRIERQLEREGVRVAGVDEVGRGCLAGPVYAACAVLDPPRLARLARRWRLLLRDSKQLSAAQRARMVPVIEDLCVDWQVASAGVSEIEERGIVPATFLAMRRALVQCGAAFELVLVDGKLPISDYAGEQRPVIKGDSLCFSIAAASILAKESRDAFMREQAASYPEFGFDAHVGYGTARHLAMIARHGICRLHRRTFEPIRAHLSPVCAAPLPPQQLA